MNSLTIFLSHSFRDNSTLYALSGALAEFHVLHDTGQAHTPALHREISSNLNRSDVVVPIITDKWLSSHECRDELVRANERRKMIIPFLHKEISGDAKLPWYLRDNLSVLWEESELTRAIDELVSKLRTLALTAWQPACYRRLRLIGDDIQHSGTVPAWKAHLCNQVLQVAESHVHNILVTDRCTFSIAPEQAYLRFAEPIFGRAETIIAVCIASISTFWTHPDFRTDAGKYLKNQQSSANSICRLFVFSSVDEVLAFRSILQKHHTSYGKDVPESGVFLCSAVTYARLLSRWSLEVDERALHQDFGLLSFGDDAQRMYASLDRHEFRYEGYEEQDAQYISNRIIVEFFRALKAIDIGAFDTDSGVARWSPEWERDNGKLASALTELFQDRSKPVTHIVLLRSEIEGEVLRDHLQQLVLRFEKQRQALKISAVSVKERCDLAVTDGRYAAPLLAARNFDYALVMEFEDHDALRHYYQHEVHSLEREELYIRLNPSVKEKFDEASRMHKGEIQERARLFSEIERIMVDGQFIMRIDIQRDDSVAQLLARGHN